MRYLKPKKLSQWMERAVDINKEYRIGKSKYTHKGSSDSQAAPKARYQPRRDAPRAQAPPNNSYVRRDPNAMDVDATREEARGKNLCFKCKKPGHRFFECPEKEGLHYQESRCRRDDKGRANGVDGTTSGFCGGPGVSTTSLANSELVRSSYVIPTLLDNEDYVRTLSEARFLKEVQKPGTVKWVARPLNDNSLKMARAVLANWVHPTRQGEVTEENVCRIRKLIDKVAVGALLELAKP